MKLYLLTPHTHIVVHVRMAIDQIYQPFPREFQVLNNHVIYLYLPVF